MTTILNLLTIRDIFTDWETSPALNAAKYHEARQEYSAPDAIFRKRLVPVELARHLAADDPQSTILFVQIKSLPSHILIHEDFQRWTTSTEYGVVWSSHDFPKSTESRMLRSATWASSKEEHFARLHEADRLVRMAAAITLHLPPVRDMLTSLRGLPDEETIRSVVAVFEKALGVTIYEAPTNTAPNETTTQSPKGPCGLSQSI